MSVAVVVHNLSANPIIRPIAILDYLSGSSSCSPIFVGVQLGKDVHIALRPHQYKAIRCSANLISILVASAKIGWSIRRNRKIVVCKLLPTTLLPFMFAKIFGSKATVHFDIEDLDVPPIKFDKRTFYQFFVTLFDWNNILLLALLNSGLLKAHSVSTRFLRRRFGGRLVVTSSSQAPHFEQFALPEDGVYKIMKDEPYFCFAGTARHHKGIVQLVDLLNAPAFEQLRLVLIGDSSQEQFRYAKKILKSRCLLIGEMTQEKVEMILAGALAVPLLSQKTPASLAQLPAKFFESMASNVPVIHSGFGDVAWHSRISSKRLGRAVGINIKHAKELGEKGLLIDELNSTKMSNVCVRYFELWCDYD